MKAAKVFGVTMILMGSIAGLGNWLWLIGVAAKPPQDLLEARWLYSFFTIFIGAVITLFSESFL